MPAAVTGALLAEWLSTGLGIGGAILKFNAQAQFAQLWGAIAIITLITLVLYNIVQIAESIVLDADGDERNPLIDPGVERERAPAPFERAER